MKKLTVFILLCLLTSTTFATETRNAGLGFIGDYIDDDSNILKFPGSLSYYRNLSILETKDFNDRGSATLNYYNPNLNLDFSLLVERDLLPTRSVFSDTIQKKITTLMVGKGNTVFYIGASGMVDHSDSERFYTDYQKYAQEEKGYYLKAGSGYSGGGSVPYDIAIHFLYTDEMKKDNRIIFNSWYDTTTYVKEQELSSGFETSLAFRSKYPLQNGSLRSYLEIGFINYDSKYSSYYFPNPNRSDSLHTRDTKTSGFSTVFGMAYEQKLTENVDLWLGLVPLDYTYILDKHDIARNYYADPDTIGTVANKTSTLDRRNTPYIFVSMEGKITSWLTARLGARKSFPFANTDSSENDEVSDYSLQYTNLVNEYDIYYGFSVHYKRFIMDASVHPDLIYNGPFMFSGTQTNHFIGYLSLSYRW